MPRACLCSLVAALLSSLQVVSAENGQFEDASLVFVGDISFSGPVNYYVQQCKNYSYEDTFVKVAPYLQASDIAIGNLESPFLSLSDEKSENRGKTDVGVFLRAREEAGKSLNSSGFQVISVANNHLNDYGEFSANTTAKVLKELGLGPLGFTEGQRDTPQVPVIKTVKGVKIGFLSYCDNITMYGCASCNLTNITSFRSGPAVLNNTDIVDRDLQRMKQIDNIDISVVYLHWGEEYDSNITTLQGDIVRNLTSLGVDVIVGSHPHVLQKHCYHNKTLVAYSLGNFLFPVSLFAGNQEVFNSFTRSYDEQRRAMRRIPFYETYYSRQNPTAESRLLRVQVNKKGVVGAQYLPLEIAFDLKTKVLYPTPLGGDKWVDVCGDEDANCSRNGGSCF